MFIRWNHDYFQYMICIAFSFSVFFFLSFFLAFFRDHPSLTVHARKLECGVKRVPLLWSRSWSRWGFGTSVNVCPDNISDRLKLVWWCIIMSQSIIREYYFAIFTVIAKIVSARFSEILQRLQSKLVWWYIIARRGKTLYLKKYFFYCFYTGREKEHVACVTVN